MRTEYMNMLEKRAAWMKWARTQGAEVWGRMDRSRYFHDHFNTSWLQVLPLYQHALQSGDPYFMNSNFCQMVDDARQTIPDDLAFDPNWMQSKSGWLWIETPFLVPKDVDFDKWSETQHSLHADKKIVAIQEVSAIVERAMSLSATELKKLPQDERRTMHDALVKRLEEVKGEKDIIDTEVVGMNETMNRLKALGEGGIRVSAIGWFEADDRQRPGRKGFEILCFQDFQLWDKDAEGFGCWSYFGLYEGDKIIDRIHQFEGNAKEVGGWYRNSKESDMNHEIRWVFAALFLMSQRLTMRVQHNVERHARRRYEREQILISPVFQVVTLRRIEEARKRIVDAGGIVPTEWQCQWFVRGHIRNQFYPSENVHRPIWVETYVKGPDDKPLKPPSTKVFIAAR